MTFLHNFPHLSENHDTSMKNWWSKHGRLTTDNIKRRYKRSPYDSGVLFHRFAVLRGPVRGFSVKFDLLFLIAVNCDRKNS